MVEKIAVLFVTWFYSSVTLALYLTSKTSEPKMGCLRDPRLRLVFVMGGIITITVAAAVYFAKGVIDGLKIFYRTVLGLLREIRLGR